MSLALDAASTGQPQADPSPPPVADAEPLVNVRPVHQVRHLVHVLLSALLVLLALSAVSAIALIRIDHLQLEPALSGSMRPVFQPGDLVIAKQTSTSTVHVGEVVAFYPPGTTRSPVMHRIVTLTPTATGPKITTKGDANNVADPWGQVTLTSSSTYRLVNVVPKLGFVSVWAHNLAASRRGLLFIGSGVLLLALAASSLRRTRSATNDHNDVAINLKAEAES